MESTLYTTVFLYPYTKRVGARDEQKTDPSALSPHQLEMRELRGFCYGIGHNLPLPKPLIAGLDETNLNGAYTLPGGMQEFLVTSFEWAIPAVAKGVYQQDLGQGKEQDYRVTPKDVADFAAKAYLALYCGGEKPFAEIVPASKEIHFDGKMYRQVVSDTTRFPLHIRRLEKVWTSLGWNHGLFPNIKGVVPLHLILRSDLAKANKARGVR